ncbi:bifunctional folylpolyglutamate synthase/dihydrofolate synthase [Pararhodospirillum oryzae]|uniref:Dihydrofolate synthase/folylpolyglutamate synthase n=1 Tax=Pararhodospirillum oryzae TaxID=478448 RepID=A0A512H8S8_9PROT|nr:folylpolyglutamate synthase/dihydrofolate synthase family protein [Pararhodospirillum oryzae]GEO81810.1 bifunctional folylpolyglutamate synthase/dihydrofolate synthase [Pararhodospirillum oryzae]
MGSPAALDRLMSLHPKTIDLSLDRVERVLAALGSPQERLAPVIHVAGTNGKGSVVAFLRAALEAAGLRVHVYTSPHLVRFNERIRLAGSLIDDAFLEQVLEAVETANAGAPLTFFEATTAAALLAFTRVEADVVLLETGLGGRLDATNVIPRPAVSVITPIDLDHKGFLGETLAAIAGEKAGILKAGVPAVIAPQAPEAALVLEARARAVGAPVLLGGRDWTWRETETGWMFNANTAMARPRLVGAHQVANAAQALAVLDAFEAQTGQVVPLEARRRAMETVDWPARLHPLDQGLLVGRLPGDFSLWVDGGHNPHAGRALGRVLNDWAAEGAVDIICGMIDSKDAAGFLEALVGPVRTLVAVPVPGAQTAAGIPAHLLADKARSAGFPDVRKAMSLAAAIDDLASGEGPGRILICGSLYLAGAALQANGTVPA